MPGNVPAKANAADRTNDLDTTYTEHQRALTALARRNRLRHLAPHSGIDFSSNDYLGLAGSNALRQAAADAIARGVDIGSGGSRLLRGNHPEITTLEDEARAHFGCDAAIFFAGGFLANTALFSTLPQRGDLVVHDTLIHASVHDGIRAGRAETAAAHHNDPQSFENEIRRWRDNGGTGRPWLAVESLYSMDGDCAPLDDLIAVADRHDGTLIIDEAHATGVIGPDGRGAAAHLEGRGNVITLHTCGKALGVMGAIICLPQTLADFMVNRCRPLIYATAPSPLISATVRAALKLVSNDPSRRNGLRQRVDRFGTEFRQRFSIEPSGSQIQPLIVGSDQNAVRLAEAMQAHGYDIRAIRPPTVPDGTSRLRIAITLNPSDAEVSDMIGCLADQLQLLKITPVQSPGSPA